MPKRKKRKSIFFPTAEEKEIDYKEKHPRGSFFGFCSFCGRPVYVRVTGAIVDHKGRPFHKKCVPKSFIELLELRRHGLISEDDFQKYLERYGRLFSH